MAVPCVMRGGEIAEANIGLMPGMVQSYDRAGVKQLPGRDGRWLGSVRPRRVIYDMDWQAGGVVSSTGRSSSPRCEGLKVRGGAGRWTRCSKPPERQ